MTAASFGPRLNPQGGVTFRLWAPAAKRVDLVIDDLYPMQAQPQGWFEMTIPEAGPGTRYRFRIDGDLIVPDPASRFQPQDGSQERHASDASARW
jgi:maltooligosyltrehalose trehalohydrolase